MSQANVENLRSFLRSWSFDPSRRRDVDLSLLDPDVTFEDTALPDIVGERYSGHQGVIRATKRWIEAYEWMVIEFEEIVDAGDRLVSIHRVRAKARHTGIEFDYPVAYLWTFRNGKVIHFRGYTDPNQALEGAVIED